MIKCAFCQAVHNGTKKFIFEVWDVYSVCDACASSPRRDFFYSQWVKRMDYVRRSKRLVETP